MAWWSSDGDDGGIDAAGEAADDRGVADLLADGLDRLGDEVAHLPVAGAAADVVEEVLEDRPRPWACG